MAISIALFSAKCVRAQTIPEDDSFIKYEKVSHKDGFAVVN